MRHPRQLCLAAMLALLLASLPACPGSDEPPEDSPSPAVTEDPDRPTEPEGGAPESADVEPPFEDDEFDFSWLTPDVRARILALPSLESLHRGDAPLFRPTGEMRVMEERFAADDSMSLLIAVEAEQRFDPEQEFAPVTLYVRATIDRDGEVTGARHVRTETSEDAELYDLLGVER